jgi:hypothetical protein
MIITGKVPKRHISAIQFFADKLFTPQKRRHLHLNVKYRKKMEYLGLASVEDYNVLGMPNAFLIEVKRNTEEEMLKTLAHEICHCLQYARGELNEEMTYWRGKKVNSDEIPYFEQPWEIEAESKGLQLYNEYMATQT